MSDTDSFIDEVNDEVRRDRLFGYLRKYGWIAALVIVGVVAGAAYNEYRKDQEEAKAQALGDAMLAALARNDTAARASALADVTSETPQGAAVLAFMTAGAQAEVGRTEEAAQTLQAVSGNADVPLIYRQVASFKSLILQGDTLDADQRRAGFEALSAPGVRLRLLAEEQLALLDIETGETQAALDRLQMIMDDAEVTSGLQRRALQAMVALGGAPQATETAEDG
ncbi:MAG: hypothetical protein AAF252_08095 [Pseudomonadota bacterium]